MADKDLAKQILGNGLSMRRRHLPVRHDQRGVAATPVFSEYSQSTIEHLLDIAMSPDEIVKQMSTPDSWQCEGKRGRTPEEAIEKAVQTRGAYAVADSKAAVVASAMGLPTMTGTPKQVAWALNIRSKHAGKHPDSPYLREQKRAAWWIENAPSL